MKKLILLAGIAALAACSKAEAPAEEEAPVETAAPVTVANGTPVGTFTVTAADGTESTTVINPDGTYVDNGPDGKVVAEGTWAVTDGKTCFTPSTEGAEAMCFTESAPGADGSFTATPDKGEPVTVRPAAAAAAAPAEEPAAQ